MSKSLEVVIGLNQYYGHEIHEKLELPSEWSSWEEDEQLDYIDACIEELKVESLKVYWEVV